MLERIRVKHSPIIIFLLFLQLVIGSTLALYVSGLLGEGGGALRFHKDITVAGVSIGGMGEKEATERLTQLVEKLYATPLLLTYQGKDYFLNKQNVQVTYDIPGTVQQATRVSQEMSGFIGAWKRWNGTAPSPDVLLQVTFNRERASSFIEELGRNINRPAREITGKVDGNRIVLQAAQEGVLVDTEKTLDGLIAELQSFQHAYRVPVAVKKENPKLTKAIVQKVDTLLTEQKQAVNTLVPEQLVNIQKAVQMLNGTILLPGDTFSFNAKAGPFSFDKGYTPVETGLYESSNPDGLAGGASQVSSVLYTAAIKSGFPVIERHAHLYRNTYAPAGLDAFVDGKDIDLRFVNDGKDPVYIYATVQNNELRLALFGSKDAKKQVAIEVTGQKSLPPDTVARSDASLGTGQEKIVKQGTDGLRVKVYASREGLNGTMNKELLSDDYYRPVSNIIASGPRREGDTERVQDSSGANTSDSSQTEDSTTLQSKEDTKSTAEKIKVQGNIIYLN